jgi:dUTP pyrophosphatase
MTTLVIQPMGEVSVPPPSYQTDGSWGLDLHAAIPARIVLQPGERQLIPTGYAIELPDGFEGQVRPRSGLALNHGVTVLNAPGTIDQDYRGEVAVVLINHGHALFVVEPRMRIAQLVVCRAERVEIVRADQLAPTRRGSGGYGSTGA